MNNCENRLYKSLQQELGAFFGTDLEMQNNNVGVGVVIVDINRGKILIGEEPVKKTANGIMYYQNGEKTIPTETRKKREKIVSNVQAAILEELYGNKICEKNKKLLDHYLYMPKTIDDRKHFMKSNISLPQTSKRADLIIVGYNGDPSEALNREGYLTNTQWLPVSEIKSKKDWRDTTKKFFDETFPNGYENAMMDLILDDFNTHKKDCIKIFPDNFNAQKFTQERNKKQDCLLI